MKFGFIVLFINSDDNGQMRAWWGSAQRKLERWNEDAQWTGTDVQVFPSCLDEHLIPDQPERVSLVWVPGLPHSYQGSLYSQSPVSLLIRAASN